MSYSADSYKNQEIRDMYYIIYNNRLREGVNDRDAKRIAYDSVSCRFGITNDRIRHILYTKGNNPAYRTFFYTNNKEIITSLSGLVAHYQQLRKMYDKIAAKIDEQPQLEMMTEKIAAIDDKIFRYKELIALIEEVNAEYSKQNG